MTPSRAQPKRRRRPPAPARRPAPGSPKPPTPPRQSAAIDRSDPWSVAIIAALLTTIGAVLFIFVARTPKFGGGQMWIVASPYKSLAALVLGLSTIALLVVRWVEEGLWVRWPRTFWPLLVLMALSGLSALTSRFQWLSFERLWEVSLAVALGAVVVQTLRRARDFDLFVGGLVAIGTLLVAFALLQALNQAIWNSYPDSVPPANRFQLPRLAHSVPYLRAPRVYATMVNSNFLGGVLVILLPITVSGLLAWQSARLRAFLVVLAVGMFVALLMTWSRGAIAGGLAGLVALYVLAAPRLRSHFRYFVHVSVAGGVLLVVLLAVGTLFIASRRADAFKGGTIQTRLIMWRGAVKAFAARPVFGHGIGAFQCFFPTYRPTDYRKERLVSFNTSHAHCEPLEVLTDMGVVGLLANLAVFVVFFRELFGRLSRSPPPGKMEVPRPVTGPVVWLGLGAAAGCAGALVDNLVGVNLRWASGLYLFWIAFGVALAAAATLKGREGQYLALTGFSQILTRCLVYPALIAALVLAGLYAHRRATARSLEQDADVHLTEAGNAVARNDAGRALGLLALALSELHDSYQRDPYLLETLYRLGHAHHMMGRLTSTPDQQEVARRYGVTRFAEDQQALALLYFDKLKALAPNYTRVHKQVGMVYAWLGDYDRGIQALERDLVFNPDYDNTDTLSELAECYLGAGRSLDAVRAYQRVLASTGSEYERERATAARRLRALQGAWPTQTSAIARWTTLFVHARRLP